MEIRGKNANFASWDITGRGLAKLLLQQLTDFGLDIQNCRGQRFDAASAMVGAFNGCQETIQEVEGKAVVFSPRLNMAFGKVKNNIILFNQHS